MLVDFDTDGSLSDAPDTSRKTMVELVRHALVNGAVHLDVDVVADLVGAEVGRRGDVPLLPERPAEEITGARSKPVTHQRLLSPLSLFHLPPGADCRLPTRAREGHEIRLGFTS